MSQPSGSLLPANFQRIWIRGQFIDLGGAPMRGTVSFIASPAVLLDRQTKHIIANKRFDSVLLDNSGKFAIELPATNDPDILPVDWTYTVREPTGRSYVIKVPYDTPKLEDHNDPFDGERVIELIDIVPAPQSSAGYVQLIAGRGIESASVDNNGALRLHYDNDTTSGPLPVGAGPDSAKDWTVLADGVAPDADLTDDFGNALFYQNTGGGVTALVSGNKLALSSGTGPAQTIRFNRGFANEVGKLGMSFSYTGITTGGSLCIAVLDQYEMNYPNLLNARCHLRVYPTGWSYDVIQNGVYSNIGSGPLNAGLPAGRKLYVEVNFLGDTADVTLPDGQKKRLHDQRIGSIPGAVASWAFLKESADPVFTANIHAMYAWRAKPWPLT